MENYQKYMEQNNWFLAKENLTDLLKFRKENRMYEKNYDSKLHIDLANIYVELKEYDMAIKEIKIALLMDEENISNLVALALIYKDKEDYRNALFTCKKAMGLMDKQGWPDYDSLNSVNIISSATPEDIKKISIMQIAESLVTVAEDKLYRDRVYEEINDKKKKRSNKAFNRLKEKMINTKSAIDFSMISSGIDKDSLKVSTPILDKINNNECIKNIKNIYEKEDTLFSYVFNQEDLEEECINDEPRLMKIKFNNPEEITNFLNDLFGIDNPFEDIE